MDHWSLWDLRNMRNVSNSLSSPIQWLWCQSQGSCILDTPLLIQYSHPQTPHLPDGILTICSRWATKLYSQDINLTFSFIGFMGIFLFSVSSSICMCSKQDGRLCDPIQSSILPGNLENFFLNLRRWFSLCSLGFVARWILEHFFSLLWIRITWTTSTWKM